METLASCPACGSRKQRQVHAGADLFLAQRGRKVRIRYVFCGGCSLVYANPRMTDAELAAIYDAEYWRGAGYERSGGRWRLKDSFIQDRLRVAAERFHLLETRSILRRFRRQGASHLDIGSGAGFLLAILKRHGWKVQGLEPTPLALFARGAGVPTERVFFSPETLRGRKFDLISLTHVFEHLKDPVGFLRQIRNFLAPRGLVWIELPDVSCPRPMDLTHPHLCFYSANTLAATLARAGFRVVHRETYHSRNAAFQVLHAFAGAGRAAGRPRKDRYRDVRRALEDALALHRRKLAQASLARTYGRVRIKPERF